MLQDGVIHEDVFFDMEIARDSDYQDPHGIALGALQMHNKIVFDRWGNLIFESNSITQGWDGTANGSSEQVQEDVYVWKIKARDCNGRGWERIGHVTVIR